MICVLTESTVEGTVLLAKLVSGDLRVGEAEHNAKVTYVCL